MSIQSVSQTLSNWLRGLIPGTSSGSDTAESANSRRLAKYKLNWQHYWGLPLDQMVTEDGAKANKVNYLKRNLDKVNYFAFGLGYAAVHSRYQQHLHLAATCWGPNKVEKLLKMAQGGCVTGDAFIMVAPKETKVVVPGAANTPDAEDASTVASSKIRVVVIPAEYCYPEYDPFDADVLDSMTIKVPFNVEENGRSVIYYQYTKITRDTVQSGVLDNDSSPVGPSMSEKTGVLSSTENPIGEVYVVHIRNYPGGNSVFGCDDVTEVAPLNSAYTERLTNIGDIVAYHSAPITCVYGARAQGLTKGPNKVWGNLPEKARVENLALNTDLAAADNHLKRIKEGIHELTGVPEIAQGTQQAISNTSGVALHTMYLPLIERANTKQGLYGPHLIEVDILCIKWCQALNLMKFVDDSTDTEVTVEKIEKDTAWDDIRQNTTLNFPSPLPKDELIQTQVQQVRITAGIQSKRGALVEIGEKNPDKKLEEIRKDAQENMEMQQKMMQAEAAAAASANPEKAADASGEKPVDGGGSSINSGAGANQGTNSTDSGAPKGRPKA